MKISLEHIADSPVPHTFRVAFHSATQRWLLRYPEVTGLTFIDLAGNKVAEWGTRFLVSAPQDDFVLNLRARIAFDIYANINGDINEDRWRIKLPAVEFQVYYAYHFDGERDWYDFLAKRSRFAAVTPIWRGSIQSNTIPFRLETR